MNLSGELTFYFWALVVMINFIPIGLAQSETKNPQNESQFEKTKKISLESIDHLQQSISNIAENREIHVWQRYVQNYREGHHFTFSTGIGSGEWIIDRLGTLENKTFRSSGVYGNFRYSYFLPIYNKFGYLLGSSMGYFHENKNSSDEFNAASAIYFPGVDFGLSYNVNPGFRTSFILSYGLNRIDGIEESDGISSRDDGVSDDPRLFVNLSVYSFLLSFDYFFSLNWGLSIDLSQKFSDYQSPVISSAEAPPVDAIMKKSEQMLGISLIYHLL